MALRQSIRRLVSSPISELNRAQRWVRNVFDLVRHCAKELRKDRSAQMAAALTYHTLFSLLPTVVVMLVGLHMFVSSDDRKQFKQDSIEFLVEWLHGGNENTTAPAAPVDAEPDDTSRNADAMGQKLRAFEETRLAITQRIEEQLAQLEAVDFGKIGVIGVLVLIFGAAQLLSNVERSFNNIFGISRSRPWYLRVLLYYTVYTMAPLLLIAGQVLQRGLINILQNTFGAGPAVAMAGVSPLLTIWLMLCLMYVLIPNTTVRIRSAAIGSLAAAVMWLIAIELLTGYVARTATSTFYGALYGALAIVPLFLMWMWLTWWIILFGLELSFTLQTLRGRQLSEEQDRSEAVWQGDPLWLVPMMAQIGRAFAKGKTIDGDDLADNMRLPVRTIHRLAEQLESWGLVHRIGDNAGKAAGYTLARPPGAIRLADLLALGRTLTMAQATGNDDSTQHILSRLIRAQEQEAADLSLESMLSDADEAPP